VGYKKPLAERLRCDVNKPSYFPSLILSIELAVVPLCELAHSIIQLVSSKRLIRVGESNFGGGISSPQAQYSLVVEPTP